MIPISVSDQTSVGFDPFNNQSKSAANNINVKSTVGLSAADLLPWLLLAAGLYLAIKLFR